MYKYGQNLNFETLYKEYKSFNFFPCGLEMSNEDCYDLVKSNKWIYNEIIIKNLKTILQLYFAKYSCAFLSSNLKQTSYLYIGVVDNGKIVGIPFQGNLDKNIILDEIKNIISYKIKCDIDIFNFFDIELIKLEHNINNYKNKINPLLNEYNKHLELCTKAKKHYDDKRKYWFLQLDTYNIKLMDLLNNYKTRLELVEYIKYYDYNNPIIKILSNINYIPINEFDESIKILKTKDPIYYWLCRWRDSKINYLKFCRPLYHYKIPCHLYPINIITHVEPMIPYWVKNNDNMNLYIIKIIYKKNTNIGVQYLNIYNEFSSCLRTTNELGPCCIQYYPNKLEDVDSYNMFD
jgi:hypothetical protein